VVEVFLTIRVDATLLAVLTQLVNVGQQILAKETLLMSTLDDDIAAIAAQTTAVASLTTFIQGLQAQIAALGLTPAQQAQVDAIFTNVTANTAAISAAMVANVVPPPVV
jgi:hypothetical protein